MRLPRLYPIIDTAFLDRRGLDPLRMARALADAGIGIVQFRHKGPYTRDLLAQAERVAEVIRKAGAGFTYEAGYYGHHLPSRREGLLKERTDYCLPESDRAGEAAVDSATAIVPRATVSNICNQ